MRSGVSTGADCAATEAQQFFAHTAFQQDGKRDLDQSRWQLLRDHLQAVAVKAREFAAPLGLEIEAEVAGLLHDLGKYARRFQDRLRDPAVRGINHWAAGAASAAELKLWSSAFAVDGHHTGIPALNGSEGLKQTLLRINDAKLREEFTRCAESTSELLNCLAADGLLLPGAQQRPVTDRFAEAFRTRMLFSCLVDADFLDTESHFDPLAPPRRCVPGLYAERALQLLLDHLAKKRSGGEVNAIRRRLLEDCLGAAEIEGGLFTLTAPTGSGKTLTSLAFALRHIVKHNASLGVNDPQQFRRVVVVIPYTSIIEQTARVYRDLFEEVFGPDYVLEHHSAVAPREQASDEGRDAEEERLQRARHAAENWEPPLVVTTSVQFFESLFAHKPSDCRKLHNLSGSVVLFDEVQTLPAPLLPSLLSGVQLLVRNYGVTAVFMTATQPAFASAGAALPYGWKPKEISSNPIAIAETMRRTRIELPPRGEQISWAHLAIQIAAQRQVLCVVNTTKDARKLFRLLPTEDRFHLSARMCPAHRLEKLQLIRERLATDEAVRLVSTQLIEAGVDVDFPVAFRAFGPLDSIIQTAGRCNREGRSPEPRPVIVFRPTGGGTPRGAYKTAAAKTEEFLARHPDSRERLHDPKFYAEYFAELYSLLGPQAAKDDPVFAHSEKFDFPKAAEECRLVGEETRSVLVRWRDGDALAEKLSREKHLTAGECRRAQRFSINLYEGEFQVALARGTVIQPADGWNFFVWNSNYDADLGACNPDTGDLIC
ncbi:MAG TPA: CRISPR-associated helicase Cas3' [Chthoniobacterales bacterium]